MPRLTLVQTNFTAGEISPRIVGRTDIDKYPNAAKALTNAHPVLHGGAVRRAGTLFAHQALSNTTRSRLVEFIVNRDTAYMLEFGELQVSIYAPNGNFILTIASPYTAAQAQDLDFTQGADTMFLWHGSVFPKRLRRFSDAIWSLTDTPFTVQPFDEQGHALAANITLSAATVGAGRTATASAAVFLPGDVGRSFISGAGLATVVGYTDTTHLTIDISVAFSGTALLSGAWYLDTSPQSFIIPTAKDPVGSTITVNGATTRAATLSLTAKTGAITINASAGVFVVGDTGKILYADSGSVTLTYVNATQCTGTTSSDFLSVSYAQGGWGITDSVFRTEDIGKFIRVNSGLLKITSLVSATQARALIVQALTSIIASSPSAWTLEASVWSAANGYPRTGTLFEQRLWAAGSTKYPQTVWGSRTGLYLDFTKGVSDSDGCIFTIASDEANPITYLVADLKILVHTYGGEFSMQGGIEKPITPSNVQIKSQSKYGSKTVRPVTVGNECLFVQRAGRKLRAMSYQFTADKFQSPDLAVLAEHITYSGIAAMAWQQEPDRILWIVLADGSMVTCTLDRDQNVTGWAHHYTAGAFESVAVVPYGANNTETVFVVVRRVINGATVRYIEVFDSLFTPVFQTPDPNAYPPVTPNPVYGTTVDCGIVQTSLGGTTSFQAAHLEGMTIDIVADGAVLPSQKVVGGFVTLPRIAYQILGGLHFRSEIALLTPEVGTGTGSAQGNSMRISEITVRFLNTIGCDVYDGDGRSIGQLSFKRFGAELLDEAPQLFTGLKRIEKLGWDRGRAEITIVQDQPLPMHVLSVIRKLTVND